MIKNSLAENVKNRNSVKVPSSFTKENICELLYGPLPYTSKIISSKWSQDSQFVKGRRKTDQISHKPERERERERESQKTTPTEGTHFP